MIELWLDIPYYEGKYQVSDQGRVRSLDRTVMCSPKSSKTFRRLVKGRILKPGNRSGYGHKGVVLCVNGREHTKQVHELVMLAFEGERPEGMNVLHNDGDPTNNLLTNLRYGTQSDNMLDVSKHGLRRVTYEEVRDMRSLRDKGVPCKDVAEMYNMSPSNASRVCTGAYYAEA